MIAYDDLISYSILLFLEKELFNLIDFNNNKIVVDFLCMG